MKKKLSVLLIVGLMIPLFVLFESCVTSKNVIVESGVSLSKYKYVVYGKEENGDGELDDIMLMVQNEISKKLKTVSERQALSLLDQGEYILSPRVNIKTEKWDGGHTYITISFFDFDTNQRLAVAKSSGIGLSISHDQQLALEGIRKQLNKLFKEKTE